MFKELVKRMAAEGLDEVPAKVRETLYALAKEEPLSRIKGYGEFVRCESRPRLCVRGPS